jgi:hypothetical protein
MSSLPIINPPDDSIPVVADNRRENKDTRLRWIPFTKTSVVRGEEVVSFPFLENENWKDLLLVRLLLVERPYKAGYGATIKAWDDIALQLRNEKHPETGELLFGHKGIKGKAIKERFLACMEFVKQQDREALRRTGTDDEAEPGEILNALEDLYSDWQSHCALGDTKNNSVAAQKKKDKDAAEAMRQASLGNLSAINNGRDDISDLEADGVLPETPAGRRLSYASRASSSTTTGTRSRSPVFSPGQHTEAIQDLITRSKEREEERARSKRAKIEQEKNKEDRENRRLSLEEARLRLDNERLEMERAERTASMQFMQALAQSLLNRNNNNNTNNNNN